MQVNKRSDEIDFLRGVAVMLVLFSHHWVFQPLNEMGWIGVDLFFVLSGFLVSGLLFAEYKKHGNIRGKLFLIRRGFKIYPLFYFSTFLTLGFLLFFPDMYLFPDSKKLILNHNGILSGFIIEAFFLQSYFFGYWGHTWSLSVEEFFYFSLVIFLYFLIRKGRLEDKRRFFGISIVVFSICLIMRVISNIIFPGSITNYTAVHLRIDSLFAGVLISYLYHFDREWLASFYSRYRKVIILLLVPLICYTPFFNVLDSVFIKTIGFTMIYTAFGLLLLIFLFEKNIVARLKRLIGAVVFRGIVKVGFYSYSIYLFHVYIVRYLVGDGYPYQQYLAGNYSYFEVLLSFVLYFFGSIGLGIGMSYLIEMPMLRLRDKYFPRRVL